MFILIAGVAATALIHVLIERSALSEAPGPLLLALSFVVALGALSVLRLMRPRRRAARPVSRPRAAPRA